MAKTPDPKKFLAVFSKNDNMVNVEPPYTPRDFNGVSRLFPFPAKKVTAGCRELQSHLWIGN